MRTDEFGSVIAESDRQKCISPERVPDELLVTLRAQIVLPLMACLRCSAFDVFFIDRFQNLMQFRKMIDIVFALAIGPVLCNLNVDLNNVASLLHCVDLTLASITGVMDHRTPNPA